MDFLRRYSIPLAIGIVALILAAFGGWFIYLHGKESLNSAVSSGRGLGTAITTSFPTGSAYSNITNAIGSVFGGNNATTTGGNTPTATIAPRLWEVGSAPTAGITWIKSATSTVARFVDQASGNVFDADPATSIVTRRTNTLVPKIAEARFAGDSGVLARFVSTNGIETLSATITKATSTSLTATAAEALAADGPGTLTGIMFPRGITSVAPNQTQANTMIFYLAPYQSGIGGFLAQPNGVSPTRIWTSSITEWNSEWVGGHILLTQKTSGNVLGNAYDLSQKGSLTPLISNQPGLSVRENPATHAILYSTVSSDNTPKLSVRNPDGTVIDLPFTTFADKCVWSTHDSVSVFCAVPHLISSDAALPDAWYRGEAHFSDAWWRFNTATGAVDEVYDPQQASHSLDILDPVMNVDGTYLGFINAADGSAWTLRINQ